MPLLYRSLFVNLMSSIKKITTSLNLVFIWGYGIPIDLTQTYLSRVDSINLVCISLFRGSFLKTLLGLFLVFFSLNLFALTNTVDQIYLSGDGECKKIAKRLEQLTEKDFRKVSEVNIFKKIITSPSITVYEGQNVVSFRLADNKNYTLYWNYRDGGYSTDHTLLGHVIVRTTNKGLMMTTSTGEGCVLSAEMIFSSDSF